MSTNQTSQSGSNENRVNLSTPQKEEDAFASPKPNDPETPSKEEPKHTGEGPVGGSTTEGQEN